MEISQLEAFFRWATIIDGSILMLWTVLFFLVPNLVYQTQARWFRFSREQFDQLYYLFIGVFKIFFIFLNLVPWICLTIISK